MWKSARLCARAAQLKFESIFRSSPHSFNLQITDYKFATQSKIDVAFVLKSSSFWIYSVQLLFNDDGTLTNFLFSIFLYPVLWKCKELVLDIGDMMKDDNICTFSTSALIYSNVMPHLRGKFFFFPVLSHFYTIPLVCDHDCNL